MMISLIYVSTATHLLSKEELLDILRVSRRNNEVGPVTGLLLYLDGNFMQVLEGPEEAVMDIFGKIEKDIRHTNIIVILKDPIAEREFSEWSMAFLNLDEIAKNESGLSDFLREDFIADKFRRSPQLAHKMLLSFKENVR
ncbi:MAG: BLUF domain-containing protein [Anaerolineales bacterium]|nr:BLUF domain-containing protein [Anaerolineales bacterium]